MIDFTPTTLNRLVGSHLNYRSNDCQVIEVLDQYGQRGPALVLQICDRSPTIQSNQYNEASRRTPEVFSVPVYNLRRDAINPELDSLLSTLL